MKDEKTYGEAAKRHALNLLANGWTAEQVKAVGVCAEIPAATLRSWKNRLQRGRENGATQTTTKPAKKRNVATPKKDAQRENATAQPEAETAKNTAGTLFLWLKANPYEVAYFTAVIISCIGIVTALQVVGLAVASVHAVVAFAALQRCKRANATADDLAAVVFSGLAVGVPSDIVWANKAVWQNVQNLPVNLRIVETFRDGGHAFMWTGQASAPFFIACYIAAFLWISTISTAWLTLRTAQAAKK